MRSSFAVFETEFQYDSHCQRGRSRDGGVSSHIFAAAGIQLHPSYGGHQAEPAAIRDSGLRVDTGIRPNIAHIVLDAYSRQDVLADLYQFDNTPFLDRLRGLGFAVADKSHIALQSDPPGHGQVFSGTMLEGSERLSSAAEVRDTVRDIYRAQSGYGNPVTTGVSDRRRRCPATIRSEWIFSIAC